MSEIEHLLEVRNVIGEGPVWHSQQGSLYWVNFIEQHQILQYAPGTRRLQIHETGIPVMALGICRSEGFVTATSSGIARWSPQQNSFDPICDPLAGRAGIRFNDAAVDSSGRFFVGSVSDTDPKGPNGELFCLHPDGTWRIVDRDITVTNGIGWSPDDKTMYLTDSFRYCIYAYDFDPDTGNVHNRRIFAQSSSEDGIPDGLTVDAEGFVWSARWGGWKVVRYNPEGKVDREYRLPVPNPTSCTFGGKHLDELYITSATLGLSQQEKALYETSGDLFCLKAGIHGRDESRFGR